jgi:hypothetical protein
MAQRKGKKVPVAIAWYAADQWQRLKEVVDDPQNFEETHAEWQGVFERGSRYLADQGFDVHRVDVDVEELAAWCRDQERPIDGKARSDFAAHKLRQKYKKT